MLASDDDRTLIVDLDASDRKAIEEMVSSKHVVPIVSYDCKTLKMYGISGNSGWGSSGSSYWAQRDTEVRLGPNSGAPLVGTLEKGARVVHWGGEANKDGWSEIRIYGSDAREPSGESFFVRENDLWGTPP